MERRKLSTEEANKQRAERKRLKDLIFDYCFTEQSGKGCASCPVSKAEACDHCHGSNEMPMKYLREAEKIILKEREAKQ
jgi:hypothetical protein